MRRAVILLSLCIILAPAGAAFAQEPRVLVSKPADGAVGIPQDQKEITIFFSLPMKTDSWSLVKAEGCELPPLAENGAVWKDPQTFLIGLNQLKPGVKYCVQLNSPTRGGFKTAEKGISLPPTVIRFETAAGVAKQEEPRTPQPEKRPDHKPMSEEETVLAHIAGGVMGIFFHELGHGLIDMLKLPITGREEDVVDEFATMLLLFAREEGVQAAPQLVYGFADLWRRVGENGDKTPWWDEHTDSMVRFGNIVCLLYGSSPQEFQPLADELKMPERRQYFCKQEYPEKRDAWNRLMKDHLKENGAQGAGVMRVKYHETKSEIGLKLQETFKNEKIYESLAEGVTAGIALPRDVEIAAGDCGVVNAFWDPENHRIVMCWEMIGFWVDLLKKGGTTTGGGGGTGGGGTGGGTGGGQSADAKVMGQWGARFDDQGITHTFQLILNDKKQYYYVYEQYRFGMRYYAEEETGLYSTEKVNITFQVQDRRGGGGAPGGRYAYRYSVTENNLTLHGLPSLNGGDLILQRMR